jgi:hemerythrin
LLERLHGVIHDAHAETTVGSVLIALVDYVGFHFSEEERLMEAAEYPGLEAHRVGHRQLTETVLSMKDEYDFEAGFIMAAELFEFLSDWLLHHIREQDMAYRPWLQRSNSATSGA